MKQLPRAVGSFDKLIRRNYLYVDKTEYVYSLINNDDYLFLSRPRRFGKTLLISTLKELFLGNRELFKGLWIDSSDYAWKPHPVIHIDFSKRLYRTPKVFEQDLIKHLIRIGKQHDIELDYEDGLQTTLSILVEELSKKGRVVVLIDEYDHPLLRHLPLKKDEEGTAQSKTAYMNREILSDFFTTLKGLDEHLRFVFATGVTKFAKTSIFSGANNFNDISWDAEYAALLGYTSDEVDTFLKPHLDNYANHRGISADDAKKEITSWYNGYRFSPEETKVFNPFSLHYCLSKKIRENYWAESGTP